MSLSAKLRRAPLRAVTGAYIVHSGVSKLSADDETAKNLHGMATGTYGFLGKVQPSVFAKGLAVGEIAVGSALLLPIVPPVVAGAALVGFSGALLNVYWHTPGMHEENDPRPTAQGVGFAKDVWMFGIGTGLIADAVLEPAHDKKLALTATVAEKRAASGRRAKRKAAKAAAKAAKRSGKRVEEGRAAVAELQTEAAKRARDAAEKAQKAQKRAEKASEAATKRIAELSSELGPVAAEKAKQAREAARSIADEYGPMAAEKAKLAREAARHLADEYGTVAAEKAKEAREAVRHLADEYGTVAAEKAKQARQTAQETAARAKERVAG